MYISRQQTVIRRHQLILLIMMALAVISQTLLTPLLQQQYEAVVWQHNSYHAEHLSHGHDVTQADLPGHDDYVSLEALHSDASPVPTLLFLTEEFHHKAAVPLSLPVINTPDNYLSPDSFPDNPPPKA